MRRATHPVQSSPIVANGLPARTVRGRMPTPRTRQAVEVTRLGAGDPMLFAIRLPGPAPSRDYRMTMSRDDYQRYTGGRVAPEACVQAAFSFLLDCELAHDILPCFDIKVMNLYRRDFERCFRARMGA
ncbi:MAG: hypothetical protein AB7Q97_01235 [Gammaproteobacteria bacterium]